MLSSSFKTDSKWLNMKKLVFKEKWNNNSKTQQILHFLVKPWQLEDPYANIFAGKAWQEGAIRYPFFQQKQKRVF